MCRCSLPAESDEVRVRLLGGANPTEGRVEVFYGGRWGSVCRDNFGAWEAAVVCKMLGLEYVFFLELLSGFVCRAGFAEWITRISSFYPTATVFNFNE